MFSGLYDRAGICQLTGKLLLNHPSIPYILSLFNQGNSCQNIKTTFPHAQDGMYQVQPDDGLNMFWVYCDMTSFGGGWSMCYSTDNLVNLKTEVTYNETQPYGTDGYRTDCNVKVNSLILRSITASQRS